MKKIGMLKGLCVLVAAVGTSFTATGTYAAESKTADRSPREAVSPIQDVALDAKGNLKGNLVDHQGRPMADRDVAIMQGRKVVARAHTDAKGQFEVSGLKGGVYDVTSEKSVSTYRVWTSETAPKKSRMQALVVAGSQPVRAQFEGLGGLGGAGTLIGIGAGGAGLGLGLNAQNDANNANDRANSLQQQLDQLQNSLTSP